MQDEKFLKNFDYKMNSNLVMTADKSLIDKRPSNEATGEVQSLAGRLTGRMGDKAEIKSSHRHRNDNDRATKEQESQIKHKRLKTRPLFDLDPTKGVANIGEHAPLLYQPANELTSRVYILLIKFVKKFLGFQSHSIIDSAAQEVIAILKNSKLDDDTKRHEVDDLLSADKKLDDYDYNDLCNLIKKIDDWTPPDKPAPIANLGASSDADAALKFDDDDGSSSDETMSEIGSDDDINLDEMLERAEGEALQLVEAEENFFNLPKPQLNVDPEDIAGVSAPEFFEGYKEYYVEPKKRSQQNQGHLINIDDLSTYERKAFSSIKRLNVIQSAIYDKAMKSDSSLLICAPTGAGKTNIAILTILREVFKHQKEDGSGFHTDKFKIIYVAPIKALVQEVVTNFSERLGKSPFNLRVDELTGDHQLDQRQISKSQIIVCTPEKWDIVTRKSIDRLYTKLVKLVIFDEIHLLHNERGATLEALVARIKRHRHIEGEGIRIVGLSATLPNYHDVARFVSTDDNNAETCYFDSSYRPIPLHQRYIAMAESKKSFRMINDIVYAKVIERLKDSQILIFVHSRPDTVKTADYIKTKAFDEEKHRLLVPNDSTNERISDIINDQHCQLKPKIKELIKFGIGTHHAGMSKSERSCIEELFRERHIKVLVSTATLAWGVNLPARTVIIKGTQVYRDGQWTDLDSLDVTQMLGRAGRPGYDREGEGIVITQQSRVGFYMSLMTEQLPVESRLIPRLADFINAECVIGNIESVEDGSKWLSETFLNSRMLTVVHEPNNSQYLPFYGIDRDSRLNDPKLNAHRRKLVFNSASLLDSRGLVVFDRISGALKSTELGRIASHYNCTSKTAQLFNKHINEHTSDVELLRTFSLAEEFKDIYVRKGEEYDLQALFNQVPFPIDDNLPSPGANKVNALLQVYMFRLNIEGSDLISDMHFIKDNASRLARAMHDIALLKGYAHVAEISFDLCRKIDKRMTICHTPLRQFGDDLDPELVDRLEKKNYQLDELRVMKPEKLADLLRCKTHQASSIHRILSHLPKLKIEANVKPITESSLKIELIILPEFEWNDKYNGYSERFWLLVQDVNQEVLLHHEMIYIRRFNEPQEVVTSFQIPFLNHPFYFIRIFADNWFGCDHHLPIYLEKLTLPIDSKASLQILDVEAENIKALDNPTYEDFYLNRFKNFNQIQTQAFKALYKSNDDLILLAPAGSGKTICAELAIMQNFNLNGPKAKCGYIATNQQAAQLIFDCWSKTFGQYFNVLLLTGNHRHDTTHADGEANIVIGDPANWHSLTLSRSKKYRKLVSKFQLYIIDDIHMLASDISSTLEWLCSKLRIATKLSVDNPARLVALGSPVTCADSIKNWLSYERGKREPILLNYPQNSRPVKIEYTIIKFNHYDYKMRILTMQRPVYRQLMHQESRGKPAFIFVADYVQAQDLCDAIIGYAAKETTSLSKPSRHILASLEGKLKDTSLMKYLSSGVVYMHLAMHQDDQNLIEQLFEDKHLSILVITIAMCWSIRVRSYITIVMDTQQFSGFDQTDYEPTDIMQVVGLTGRPLEDHKCKCVIMVQSSKAAFYDKFLREPLPIESDLPANLISHVNYEVATGAIVELNTIYKPYIAHTLFYKRITANPNYYGVIAPVTLTNEQKTKVYGDFFNHLVNKVNIDLKKTGFAEGTPEDPALTAGLLSKISLEYYINYETLAAYSEWFKSYDGVNDIRTLELIELISEQTFEFSSISIKQGELQDLKSLQRRHRPREGDQLHDPAFKVKLLILSQYQRTDGKEDELEGEMLTDRYFVISFSYRLLMAILDIAWLNDCFHLAKTTIQLAKKLCPFNRESDTEFDITSVIDSDTSYNIELEVTRQEDPFSEEEFNQEFNYPKSMYRDEGWCILIFGIPPTEDEQEKFLLFKRVKTPARGKTSYKLSIEKEDIIQSYNYDLYFMSDFYSKKDKAIRNIEKMFSVPMAE